jgi:hypothetical protein
MLHPLTPAPDNIDPLRFTQMASIRQEGCPTSDNPYQSPLADLQVVGAESRKHQHVQAIAVCQRGIIICLVIQFLVPVGGFLLMMTFFPLGATQLARDIVQVLGLVFLAAILVAMGLTFVLCLKVYTTAAGILMAVLALVPCLGLFVLLMANGRATFILIWNGHKVGLLGARLSEFKYSLQVDPASPHPDPLPKGEGEQVRELS